MSRIDESRPFVPVRIAVLTVSDTRTLADDAAGNLLAERIEAAGHELVERAVVPADAEEIRLIVGTWIAEERIDVAITIGGTGFGGRDGAPETLEPLFDKRMDGFSVLCHQLSSAAIGTSTMLSRATAGLAGHTFVFCLPGSPGACRDAWDGILSAQLDHRHRPCNLVEILPQLAGSR